MKDNGNSQCKYYTVMILHKCNKKGVTYHVYAECSNIIDIPVGIYVIFTKKWYTVLLSTLDYFLVLFCLKLQLVGLCFILSVLCIHNIDQLSGSQCISLDISQSNGSYCSICCYLLSIILHNRTLSILYIII